MSRANDSAFPIQESDLSGSIPAQHGLTIREHVALEFAAAIVASGRKSSSDVTGVMIETSEYVRAWLAEFTKEPRS